MFNTMLVAVDGSDHASKAVDIAADLAEKYGAKLLILSVYKHLPIPDNTHSMVRAELQPEARDAEVRAMTEGIVRAAVERVHRRGDLPAEGLVQRGQPARTIVEVAKQRGAQAIVMGSRGLGDVGGFLLGSVSHKVSSLAECTVIMVK